MRQLSSLDYHHLVKEFQSLVGARIDKVYQDKEYFLFVLYNQGSKHNLVINIPNSMYLTPTKPSFKKPGGFCMFLRKRLQTLRITSIEQLGFDRIIKIVAEKDEVYNIYIELFNKGNLIVCDKDDKIISLYNSIIVGGRELRGGVKYEPPTSAVNIPALSEEEFKKFFGEKEAVLVLASDLSLGGAFAEFLLDKVGEDKNTKSPDTKKLFAELQNFLSEIKPEYTEDNAFPFNMHKGTSTSTFSEAIAKVVDPERESKEKEVSLSSQSKKKSKIAKIVAIQEKQLKKLETSGTENQRKGELLYEYYQDLNALLKQAVVDRKELSDEEFKTKYESHELIHAADKQRITVELE